MYKIGEFSKLAKVSIKTLRYYEKEKLLIPFRIDKETGYRFYETKQLLDLLKIISLRQIGFSIFDIKRYINSKDLNSLLIKRKQELENELIIKEDQLQRIKNLMEDRNMKYETIIKELSAYNIYYKEGVLKDYSEMTSFILSSADECLKTNPNIKCITPDYCYMNYLDGEYKEKDIKVRYAQAVEEKGIENDTIKFDTLNSVTAACVYHKGSYTKLGEAYGYVIKWIEDNGYEIIECPRERYIDGIWNKENEDDYLTEIEVPVIKK